MSGDVPLDQLTRQVVTQQMVLKEIMSKLETIQRQNVELNEENQRLHETIQKCARLHTGVSLSQETLLSKTRADAEALRAENDELRASVQRAEELQKALDVVTQERQAFAEELAALDDELTELRAGHEHQQTNSASLEQEFDEMKRQLSETRTREQRYLQQIQFAESQTSDLRSRLETERARFEATDIQLRQVVSKLRNENSALRTEAAAVADRADALAAELGIQPDMTFEEALAMARTAKTAVSSRYQERIQGLEEELAVSAVRLEEAEKHIELLQNEAQTRADNDARTIQKLRASLEAEQRAKSTVIRERDSAQAEAAALRTAKASWESDKTLMQQRIAILQQNEQQLQDMLEKLQKISQQSPSSAARVAAVTELSRTALVMPPSQYVNLSISRGSSQGQRDSGTLTTSQLEPPTTKPFFSR